MKKKFPYQSFRNFIVCVLLIGQFWACTIAYCTWLVYIAPQLITLFSSEDSETEETQQDKKEKYDELTMDFRQKKIHKISRFSNLEYKEDILSIHHPEISTPPPEFTFLS